MKTLMTFAFLIVLTLKLHAQINLTDVSILFPLPNANQLDQLISVKSASNLLPESVFQQISFLTNTPNEQVYPSLKVIGVRLDPCFQEGSIPVACRKLIRFVWQPVVVVNQQTETTDAALHVFFDLNDQEFKKLITSILNLKSNYSALSLADQHTPLGVHPLLKLLGLNSNYAKELKKILITTVQNKNMSRITFMKLKGDDDFWVFGGLNFNGQKSEPIKISQTDEFEQEFINSFAKRPHPTGFDGGIFSEPNSKITFNPIVKDSRLFSDLAESEVVDIIKYAAEIDHPAKNNPGTVDCVSCHISNMVKEWLFKNSAISDLQNIYKTGSYQDLNNNLTNLTEDKGETNHLRMFGYLNNKAVISQRTINESAVVVNQINNFLNCQHLD